MYVMRNELYEVLLLQPDATTSTPVSKTWTSAQSSECLREPPSRRNASPEDPHQTDLESWKNLKDFRLQFFSFKISTLIPDQKNCIKVAFSHTVHARIFTDMSFEDLNLFDVSKVSSLKTQCYALIAFINGIWQLGLTTLTTSWFQEGEDLDDLLAEINEELPSEEEDEDIDPTLTNVQRRVINLVMLWLLSSSGMLQINATKLRANPINQWFSAFSGPDKMFFEVFCPGSWEPLCAKWPILCNLIWHNIVYSMASRFIFKNTLFQLQLFTSLTNYIEVRSCDWTSCVVRCPVVWRPVINSFH